MDLIGELLFCRSRGGTKVCMGLLHVGSDFGTVLDLGRVTPAWIPVSEAM